MGTYTELGLFVIKEIYESGLNNKEISTWGIAKRFQWNGKLVFDNKKDEDRFLTRKSNIICKRLKRMSKEGIIKITKERKNKNVYNLIGENVIFKKRCKFPDSCSNAIFIRERDRKWIIFEF